jgi:DNA repair protein RadA/Sms
VPTRPQYDHGSKATMAKVKTNYTCTECGGVSNNGPASVRLRPVEHPGRDAGGDGWRQSLFVDPQSLAQTAPVLSLADIEAIDVPRFGTGIEEFDRVLGGGLVPGGVALIGGDPGIGKSTLLLQALANISKLKKVLYVSGEESGAQIALRAKRLAVDARELQLQAEIQLEKILATLAEHKPEVAVIDSIQTVYSDALTRRPARWRRCANARRN